MTLPKPQPLRYSRTYPQVQHLPGHTINWKPVPTPRNCRRLLSPRPPGKPEPEALPKPPEVYDWVAEWLTDYQSGALRRHWHASGWALWWACGAGKTVAACYWALALPGPVVIVTRAGTRHQFAREMERIADVKVQVLEKRDATEDPIEPGVRCVSLGWELLPYRLDDLLEYVKGGQATALFDELHRAKAWKRTEKYVTEEGHVDRRPTTNISASTARLSRACARRAGLTATPFRTRLSDLWSQLDILEPDCWGSNWEFVHRYCDAKPGQHGGLDTTGVSNRQELNTRLRELVSVVTQEQVSTQLPPKRRQLALIRASEQNRTAAFASDIKRAARYGKQAVFETQLAAAASRKREWVADTVVEYLERGQHVTVFTGRKQEVHALEKAIQTRCRKARVDAVIQAGTGDDSLDDRSSMCLLYGQTKGAACLIGTGQAFGEGLDGMQFTDLAIFQLLPWTPAEIEQWEGRFVRLGQDRPVLILFPVAERTVDEHVADLLIGKLQQVDSTVAQLGVQSEAGGVEDVLSGDQDELIAGILAAYGGKDDEADKE